jgi:hypothetical protein
MASPFNMHPMFLSYQLVRDYHLFSRGTDAPSTEATTA